MITGSQREVAEQLTLLAQHPDIEVGDPDDDPAAAMGPTDSHVVELRPEAQSEDPAFVDLVVT